MFQDINQLLVRTEKKLIIPKQVNMPLYEVCLLLKYQVFSNERKDDTQEINDPIS